MNFSRGEPLQYSFYTFKIVHKYFHVFVNIHDIPDILKYSEIFSHILTYFKEFLGNSENCCFLFIDIFIIHIICGVLFLCEFNQIGMLEVMFIFFRIQNLGIKE